MKRFLVTLLCAGGPLFAQGTGDYFNVESPQVKPIAIARVAGHDYLLVCNTPDNSVEIYDTHTHGFVARVRTGAEPISVEFNPVTQRLYTANFLGDSVTVASLSAAGPSAPLLVQFETTLYVGDEPADVAFSMDGSQLLVTLSSTSSVRVLDAMTLAPIPPLDLMLLATVSPQAALKEPRAIVVAPLAGSSLGRVIVANAKGGKAGVSPFAYDMDLWSMDLSSGPASVSTTGALGTTHHGVAVANNGDVWVCGTDALFSGTGVATHAAQPTGFVRSMLWQVPAGGGTPAARDINVQASAGIPVVFSKALSQPTDIVLLEGGGGVQKVYLAAFHSDRIGVVSPVGGSASWVIQTIDIGLASQPNPGAVSGPRGLALKAPSGLAGDPGSRLYVMNRLDNSVAVVDTSTDVVVATFALQHDPTPAYIKRGRKFLYSANLSGNGFVSCASCHVDGRTDNIGWDLSNNTAAPIPSLLVDGVFDPFPSSPTPLTFFPANKGRLVTQTLQGLATWEVNAGMQYFFSTQPLHWRGDKARFEDFNEAFVNLQGMTNIGTATDPKGLTGAEMEEFRAFVFSIHYPPNPEQPLHRVYSGSIGQADVIGTGSGAREGNKLFHQRGLTSSPGGILCNGRACVQCHGLMAGGNRMITDLGIPTLQPLESSALRLLRQKEAMITINGNPTPSGFVTSNFGLDHEGKKSSINDFDFSFAADLPGTSELFQVNQFVREFDTGTAPSVGLAFTATTATPSSAVSTATSFAEDQAQRANAGLAVQAVIGGVDRGFWYDVLADRYVEEPSTIPWTRGQLLALLAGAADRLVFLATPLGSERRFAWPLIGSPLPVTGPAPSNLKLQPMPTNTAWADVPNFPHNWDPLATGSVTPFKWGIGAGAPSTPPSLLVMRNIQRVLMANPAYGVTAVKHEAPRRFAISGDGIRHGATLWLLVNSDVTQLPATSTTFEPIVLPLHPTSRFDEDRQQIWESHVELDPFMLYVFLAGGPWSSGVLTTIGNVFSQTWTAETLPAGTIDPSQSNWYYVVVVNRDGSYGVGGLQQLRLQ